MRPGATQTTHTYCQVWGLLGGAIERGAKKVRLHILTDGRDVADGSSMEYVEKLEKYIEELNSKGADVKIASGGGRMRVTMDRYEVGLKKCECRSQNAALWKEQRRNMILCTGVVRWWQYV